MKLELIKELCCMHYKIQEINCEEYLHAFRGFGCFQYVLYRPIEMPLHLFFSVGNPSFRYRKTKAIALQNAVGQSEICSERAKVLLQEP